MLRASTGETHREIGSGSIHRSSDCSAPERICLPPAWGPWKARERIQIGRRVSGTLSVDFIPPQALRLGLAMQRELNGPLPASTPESICFLGVGVEGLRISLAARTFSVIGRDCVCNVMVAVEIRGYHDRVAGVQIPRGGENRRVERYLIGLLVRRIKDRQSAGVHVQS